jgi:hypothetical protein
MNKFHLCQKLAIGCATLSSLALIDTAIDPAQASTINWGNRAVNSLRDLDSVDDPIFWVIFGSEEVSLIAIPKGHSIAPFTAVSSPDLIETLKPDEGIFELVTGSSSEDSTISEFGYQPKKEGVFDLAKPAVVKFKADPQDPEAEQPIFVGEFDPHTSPPALTDDSEFEIDLKETTNVTVDLKGAISNLFGVFTEDNFASHRQRIILGRTNQGIDGGEYQVAEFIERKTYESSVMFGLLALGGLGLGMNSKKQGTK